jgi:flagellar motility protein MotE (MotC chaperone)
MIVTRQRAQKRNLGRFVLPLIAIVALIGALVWPPSHKVIADGPLRPLWSGIAAVYTVAAKPLSFAMAQQRNADLNRTIRGLNDELEANRKSLADRDGQIKTLQSQVKSLQLAAASGTPTAPPAETTVAATTTTAQSAEAAASTQTAAEVPQPTVRDDPKRVAAVWSAMDPEAAAAVAAKLPEAYTARVFSAMGSDAVGEVMAALPAAYAARVTTQIHR